MRIVQLHWAFPPVVGGVETHLEELGAALVQRGHQVYAFVGASADDEQPRRRVHRGVEVTSHPAMQLGERHDPEEVYRHLSRYVDEKEPDLIHAHNMHYFSPAHAEALARLKAETGVPILLTAHNAWNDELGTFFLRFAGLWDHIVAVSHYLKGVLVAQGYPEDRFTVIHHGIDPQRWAAEPPDDRVGPVIFHPARLSIDKGSLLVVQAFHKVREVLPEARLILAGTGKIVDFESRQAREVQEVEAAIARYGLREAVALRAIPWSEIPSVFRQSRVVVYPSRFDEPFGIAALEGMASSRPVVVSRVGGMPEFVRDGVDGFVIPQDDAEALAEACLRLLSRPRLVQEMGRNARQRATVDFHLRRMVDQVEDVYVRVTKRSRATVGV